MIMLLEFLYIGFDFIVIRCSLRNAASTIRLRCISYRILTNISCFTICKFLVFTSDLGIIINLYKMKKWESSTVYDPEGLGLNSKAILYRHLAFDTVDVADILSKLCQFIDEKCTYMIWLSSEAVFMKSLSPKSISFNLRTRNAHSYKCPHIKLYMLFHINPHNMICINKNNFF
jgi:hypothetical protein